MLPLGFAIIKRICILGSVHKSVVSTGGGFLFASLLSVSLLVFSVVSAVMRQIPFSFSLCLAQLHQMVELAFFNFVCLFSMIDLSQFNLLSIPHSIPIPVAPSYSGIGICQLASAFHDIA